MPLSGTAYSSTRIWKLREPWALFLCWSGWLCRGSSCCTPSTIGQEVWRCVFARGTSGTGTTKSGSRRHGIAIWQALRRASCPELRRRRSAQAALRLILLVQMYSTGLLFLRSLLKPTRCPGDSTGWLFRLPRRGCTWVSVESCAALTTDLCPRRLRYDRTWDCSGTNSAQT